MDSGATKQFIKQDSALVKSIKEIYVVPPAEMLPFIKMLQAEHAKLKMRVGELQTSVDELQTAVAEINKYIKRKESKKESSRSAR